MELGAQFSRKFRGGDVVAIQGELGTGKTHFVKGVCRGLGYEGIVSSPTFALIQEYATTPTVYHVDLYRIESASQLVPLGLEELMQPSSIVLIEWPLLAASLLPPGAWHVDCGYGGNETDRTFLISRAG